MQQLSNFEAVNNKIDNNTHTTTDNLSANLYNFIRDDFNANRMEGSSLVQNDVPNAFRGGNDFEIVDNSVGKSLTNQSKSGLKQVESGGTAARSSKDAVSRAPDEMPSSGRPAGATGEQMGRGASGDQRSNNSLSNSKNDAIDEMPSKGKPAGATGEGQKGSRDSGDTRSSEVSNRKNVATDEMPSSGRPTGAREERATTSNTPTDLYSSEGRNNETTEEMPSRGIPLGAWPESVLKGQEVPSDRGRGVTEDAPKLKKLNVPNHETGYM